MMEESRVELITHEEQFDDFFRCLCASFGRQTKDPFWCDLNPGWETEQGFARGKEKHVKRWRATRDADHTWFLLAVVTDTHGTERVGGAAVWTQESLQRNAPAKSLDDIDDVEALAPNDATRQRFLRQVFASFVKRHYEVVSEASAKGGSVMALNVCVVDPAFQKRGLARKLVQWGLDKADERQLPCFTEASSMGRPVYEKMGFQVDGPLVYEVDDEFKGLPTAANTCLYRPAKVATRATTTN